MPIWAAQGSPSVLSTVAPRVPRLGALSLLRHTRRSTHASTSLPLPLLCKVEKMNTGLTRPWGMNVELMLSSCERTSKARTAFLVAPLAMVDRECMGLDGPTIIHTYCLSDLAARVATGAPMVRVRVYRCVIGGTFDEMVRSDSGRPTGSVALLV